MKNLLRFFVYLLIPFTFTQCKKAIFDEPNSAAMLENASARLESKSSDSDSAMVLGKKLENPYSVKNMEIALNSLERKSSKNPIGKIESNYLYIRLLPTTNDEYNLINSDPTIDTYEYPLRL
jgi:hypothetical protein